MNPLDFPMRCSVCGFDIEDEDELAFTESGAACHEECREEWELIENPDFSNAMPWGVK